MCHRADYSNVRRLAQGEDIIVILKKDDRLSIKLTRQLDSLIGMDVFRRFVVRSAGISGLKQSELEFDAEDTGDGGVNDALVQLA